MGVYRRVDELTEEGETVALVTVTSVTDSAPRAPGTAMIVRENGDIEGTIGGGTVEHLAKTAAQEAIEVGEPRDESFELRPGGNTGMVCDGAMDVFINVLQGTRQLVVVGGGHIAVPVVRFGTELGYRTVVLEDRDEFATPDRFPQATLVNAKVREGFDQIELTDRTAVVIATRSSTLDRRAAELALPSEAFYVGCVSSGAKAAHIREGLHDDELDPALIDALRAPVGLDLGADTPAQIALSILAEVEAVRTIATAEPHSGIETSPPSESEGNEASATDGAQPPAGQGGQ